jgi:hypothetical protein
VAGDLSVNGDTQGFFWHAGTLTNLGWDHGTTITLSPTGSTTVLGHRNRVTLSQRTSNTFTDELANSQAVTVVRL